MLFERNIVFWLAALVVVVALLWLLSPILLPFVLGMALAYVLDPLAERLSKRGMSRLIAAILILGGFILAFVILLLLIVPVLMRQFAGLIENAPGYAQRLEAFVSDPSHPWIKHFVGGSLVGADKSVGDLLNQAAGYVTGLLAFGFVGLLLAVPLAAAAGVLIRFAVRRYLASPLYTGSGSS
jgi:predicted PurR-regulated permease PerM